MRHQGSNESDFKLKIWPVFLFEMLKVFQDSALKSAYSMNALGADFQRRFRAFRYNQKQKKRQ